MLLHPLNVYTLSFLFTFLLYIFGWSSLYPKFSWQLILFFVVTFIINTILFTFLNKKKKVSYYDIKSSKKYRIITIIILACYVMEFIYEGKVPFISIILHEAYNYKSFVGIPTFHMILITFNPFFATLVFQAFLSIRKKEYLFLFLLNILPALLLFSRGMLLAIILNCIFVYLLSLSKFKLNKAKITGIILTFICSLIILYFFGVLGNIRIAQQIGSEKKVNKTIILDVGEATEKFRNSSIPKEYFWAYLYASSPLANLQNTINSVDKNFEFKEVPEFIKSELIWDFISKRIGKSNVKYNPVLITPHLTVSSVYIGPYLRLGWTGMYIMYIFTALMILIYILALSKYNKYYVTGICILNTLLVLNLFSNMFVYSAISFQLAYPLFLGVFEKLYKSNKFNKYKSYIKNYTDGFRKIKI
ncbi:oligosaccharide repeat unit polymerase [Oceanirhabdus sp. W0125-5]|uniref:oligosaccharide repeat unit polymerase n=1 Tax=Oceanirhabdus sp. W0125-5 TaxID=2999116 RepID=UPI0022F3373C|nr:oligosaccharide repeat unit polymerase [Oceanirhabdus sp. W0125-5]WBW98665.1 oligosaccharide repeat unit polymerase [Oceanirhabdus sp. W0125-5]